MRLFLLILLSIQLLSSAPLTRTKISLKSTFENVSIDESEKMGLASISYLINSNQYINYGMSLFGTFTGIRGGFFTGGLTLGVKYPIYNSLYLDGGTFFGGGGGGSAPQGGGMMLRSYIGTLYGINDYDIGLHYSNITFPNGDIKSNQISFVLQSHFETSFFKPNYKIGSIKKYNFINNHDYMIATFQLYYPKANTYKTDSTPLEQTIHLTGFEYGRNISQNLIAYLETAGAMGGDSTGYMEVLGGLAYSYGYLKFKQSLGSAGGGRVKTDGGSISKSSIEVNTAFLKNLYSGIEFGYYHAFEGDFNAKYTKFNLGIKTNFLSISSKKIDFDYSSISSQKFNIRLTNQTYQPSQTLRKNSNNERVELLGLKMDYFLNESTYLSGQAFGAYIGKAGGYAVGFFGLGHIKEIYNNISLVTEIDFGASGGGSIASGDGNVVQPMVGFLYSIDKSLSFELLYGQVMATDGELNTGVLDFSLVYRFDKLVGS